MSAGASAALKSNLPARGNWVGSVTQTRMTRNNNKLLSPVSSETVTVVSLVHEQDGLFVLHRPTDLFLHPLGGENSCCDTSC